MTEPAIRTWQLPPHSPCGATLAAGLAAAPRRADFLLFHRNNYYGPALVTGGTGWLCSPTACGPARWLSARLRSYP